MPSDCQSYPCTYSKLKRRSKMPSDCQCSTPRIEYVDKIKVLNNKEATRKIARLEEQVKTLKSENSVLKRSAKP